MPAVAHMLCHSCGAQSEGPAFSRATSVIRCRCGGVRQVVRIVRHPRGGASASLEELERSVQERADDETLTPVPKDAPVAQGVEKRCGRKVDAEEGRRGWIG
jgi:hypothetical protein